MLGTGAGRGVGGGRGWQGLEPVIIIKKFPENIKKFHENLSSIGMASVDNPQI